MLLAVTEVIFLRKECFCFIVIFNACHDEQRDICPRLIRHAPEIVHQALKNKEFSGDPDIDHALCMFAAEARPLTAAEQHRSDLSGTDRRKTCLRKAAAVPVNLFKRGCIKRGKGAALFICTFRIENAEIKRINLPQHRILFRFA